MNPVSISHPHNIRIISHRTGEMIIVANGCINRSLARFTIWRDLKGDIGNVYQQQTQNLFIIHHSLFIIHHLSSLPT